MSGLWACFKSEIPEANSFVYLLIEKATTENILISSANKKDADFLIQLAKKLGFKPLVVSDDEKRMIARKQLIKIADRIEKSEVNEDEIQYEIDKVRRKRHAKKK
jgi:NADPH:quinone reductase-like Zn-dependent oxidoreductase